jgi:hypothetical protein
MNPLSTIKLASLALCAALAACQTTADQAPSAPVRARAPQGYEKAITNYLAFRIRGSQKDAEVNIGTPEPGTCTLDGFNTTRGWVVPVVYATRTGVPSGKETINITTRQYYFWFIGETIAGLTPRVDLCPGGALTEFPQPPSAPVAPASAAVAASARAPAPSSASASGDASTGEAAGADKRPPSSKGKKSGASSGAGKPVKKADPSS